MTVDTAERTHLGQPWPYPVRYNETTELECDVLVLGGGVAGCHAAINAARKGASVIIVDKASIVRSGSGGTGVDHWHGAVTNPASTLTPEEMIKEVIDTEYGGSYEYGTGISTYICLKEGYDTLLDLEKMGLQIRDVDDEFKGAAFRDEASKLLFAYDYTNKHCVRFMGGLAKPVLHNELKRLGVKMVEHVMSTGLLNEGGQQGARVVGGTGFNVRTGEYFVFKSKATVLAMSYPNSGQWIYNTELNGMSAVGTDPNCSGEGHVMAWRAGAEMSMMEYSEWGVDSAGGFGYPWYGTGNANNTWYACTIVDSNGKEVPWVDRDGEPVETVAGRYETRNGQKLQIYAGFPYSTASPQLTPDLPERIQAGEFTPPFYADVAGMPEEERKVLWGLMLGNEGKTRIPILENYCKAGFDPDKDMLEANILPIEMYSSDNPWWTGIPYKPWRMFGFVGGGGPVYDWDLKTSVEGLYGAGSQLLLGGDYATSSTTGRYAGRKAADYAANAGIGKTDKRQIALDKNRVYKPLENEAQMGWKELWGGIARTMQSYLGEYKNEEILNKGLSWFKEIRTSEAKKVKPRNPHELWRFQECMTRITIGEMISHSSLARKASSEVLNFQRLDFPDLDPPEWQKFITLRLNNNEIKTGEKEPYYWLKQPYAATYEENYNSHCGL